MSLYEALDSHQDPSLAVAGLLQRMLSQKLVKGVLVPTRQRYQHMVMQTLIVDPAKLDAIDPFAPVVPTNSAPLVASLTAQSTGERIAAVLRSCEVRAFLELVKLNQGHTDNLILIGVDCLGRYENNDYRALANGDNGHTDAPGLTLDFLQRAISGGGTQAKNGSDITNACKCCEYPVANNVDLRLCVLGDDPAERIWVEATSEKGEEIFAALDMAGGDGPPERDEAIRALEMERIAFRDQHLSAFRDKTRDIHALEEIVAGCINCYNCRVACPVCYCRDCVFNGDTFRHNSELYLNWATKRGEVKMPTDTVFYHLTRMVHMSTMCVGCGQCTSVCPNDIPVMELFRSTAELTQGRFDYVPGRRLDEGQPLAVFHAEEFGEVTGQVK